MALFRSLIFPSLAVAHFTLNSPPAVGPFDEDKEADAPCGGVTINFSSGNVTDFHVGGEPLDLFLGHPSANWLFRATLDQTGSSNWTQLYPIVAQTGLGDYCQTAVAAPSNWTGQKGVLGVVAESPDGMLYQCATVNFVSGSGTYGSECNNGSAVSSTFGSSSNLAALVSSNSSTTSGTSTASSSKNSSSASIATGLVPSVSGLLGSLAVLVTGGLVGAGFLL